MTYRLSFFLMLLILIACDSTSTDSQQRKVKAVNVVQQDTSVVFALNQLYVRLKKEGYAKKTVSLKKDQIQIGDTIIRLKIKVEYQGKKEAQEIYAANYITILLMPSGKSIEVDNGVIGMGPTPQDAFKNCVQDWMNILGTPLINLLQKKNRFNILNMHVYAGAMGIHGQMPGETWLKGDQVMSRKILSGVGQLVKSNNDNIVPVDIKLLVEKGKVVSGECRLGNIVSFELLKKMKDLPWPKKGDKFIFSQFYLVEKKGVK